jgi:hypothetical protein
LHSKLWWETLLESTVAEAAITNFQAYLVPSVNGEEYNGTDIGLL